MRPFQHLVDALRERNGLSAKKPIKAADDEENETQADDQDDDEPIEDVDNGDECRDQPKSLSPQQVASVAADVVRAGAQRRGEVDVPYEVPIQPRTAPLSASEARTIAQQIVAVGKARRGEAP